MYVGSKGKKVLVIGAGSIGSRRLATIAKFDFDICVISKTASETVENLLAAGRIEYLQREFVDSDITDDIFMVLACTDNREINKKIGQLAKAYNIYVSVADSKDEGNFFYPGISAFENMVIGVCGDGTDHVKTKNILHKIKELFEK